MRIEGESGSRLEADEIGMNLDPKTNSLRRISGYGEVELSESERSAQSEQLFFDLNRSIVVLGGAPAMAWDERQGVAGELILAAKDRLIGFGTTPLSVGISLGEGNYRDAYGPALELRPWDLNFSWTAPPRPEP